MSQEQNTQALPGIDLDKLTRYEPCVRGSIGAEISGMAPAKRGTYVAFDDVAALIAQARAAQPTLKLSETYANLLSIQRAEAETGDPYMVGLYNGMAMMCANVDGDLNWQPLAAQAAVPVVAASDEMRQCVRDAVAEAMSGLYYCGRVWSAWGVGTMSESDFSAANEDDDIIEGVAEAAINAMVLVRAAASQAAPENTQGEKCRYCQGDGEHHQERGVYVECDACDGTGIRRGAAKAPAAQAVDVRADEIVTALYRRFKDWSKRGFGPDDVTWCEVKADVLALIAATPASTPEASQQAAAVAAPSHETIVQEGETLVCTSCGTTVTAATTSEDARDAALEQIAKLIEKKVYAYQDECGSYDHSTGVTEYPGNGAEWVNEMEELAEEIRALKLDSAMRATQQEGE